MNLKNLIRLSQNQMNLKNLIRLLQNQMNLKNLIRLSQNQIDLKNLIRLALEILTSKKSSMTVSKSSNILLKIQKKQETVCKVTLKKKSPVSLFTKKFINHPIRMSYIVGRRHYSQAFKSEDEYEPDYELMGTRTRDGEIGPNFPKQIFYRFTSRAQSVERNLHTPENLLRFYDMKTGSPEEILANKQRGTRYTADFKEKAVNWYKKKKNFHSTAERFGCSVSSLRNWVKQNRFGNRYSISFRKRAVALYAKNRNFKSTAERFGCSVSSVRNWVKLYWDRDDTVLNEGCLLKEEHHSYLKRRLVEDNKICLKKNHSTNPKPRCTVKNLKSELMEKFKVDISPKYLGRVIKKMGFSLKRSKKIQKKQPAVCKVTLEKKNIYISSSEKTHGLRLAHTLSRGKKSPVDLFTKRFIHYSIGMSYIVGRRHYYEGPKSEDQYEPDYELMETRTRDGEIGPNFPKQIFSLFSRRSQSVERNLHTPENLLRFYDMETRPPAEILANKRRGNRYTADFKKKVVNWYKKEKNFHSTAERFNCSVASLRNWVKKDRFGGKYSVSFKKRVVNLYEKNRNFTSTAKRFGCSVSSVKNWVKLYWDHDDTVLNEGSLLKEEHHSYLKRRLVADNKICSKKNHPTKLKPRCTVKKLKSELMEKFEVDISLNYLARVIKKMGFSLRILKKIHEDHIDQCLADNWKMSVPKLRKSLMLNFSLDISNSQLGRIVRKKKVIIDDEYFDSCSLFKQRRDWPKPKDDVEMPHEEYYLYHYLQCPKPPKPWVPDTSRFREYFCPTEWENVWRDGPEPEVPEETEDEKIISAMLEKIMPALIPAPLVLDFSSTEDPNYVEITHFKAGDDDPWWNGIDPFADEVKPRSRAQKLGDKQRGNRRTADFKKEAVNWYKKKKNFRSTAERFNCSVSSLRNWVKQDKTDSPEM